MKLSDLKEKIMPYLAKIVRYKAIIFFIVLAVIFGYLFYTINSLSSRQPDDNAINDKYQSVTRPHIDQSVIDKIKQLQDNSVQIKSLFNQARNNPFSECLDANGNPTKPPNCVN